MAMNAHAQALVGLITSANFHFVVPVYQRPYSWDIEQCEQLWDDIIFVGNNLDGRHFTGSIVWVQDGTISASGVSPMLLIDGQQRITTLTLLIAALADYARKHKDEPLRFSYEEIIQQGYLLNTFRQGEGRYKLSLSKGDKPTLESLLENLLNEDNPIVEDSTKLLENYKFFCDRLEALEDPNVVWDGIQRLDVVSISLDANQDNPQLIFESMNSTGKDLSSADLIRNYVLMGLPKEEQDSLYLNHWRNIELTLGADSYEDTFDEFIRNYLTVIYATEPLAKRDIYTVFKRHVTSNGYNKDGKITELLKEMERFAKYYSHITRGTEQNQKRNRILAELRKLDSSVINPLLLSLYDDYEQSAFDDEQFNHMLELIESYVFRRSICDVPTNTLNKFLPTIIARLNKVQDLGGDYLEAFEAFLMLESGTSRRFPDNAEFFNALIMRDAYHYRRALYLLSNLENMHHTKDPLDLTSGAFSIEHVMPQNAQASIGWKGDVGQLSEEDFVALVNNLGNLTLTAYNSELSDDSFADKKTRYVGGYGKDYLVISDAMRTAEAWDEDQIKERAKSLARDAVKRWKNLSIDAGIAKNYEVKKTGNAPGRSALFKNVFEAGLIPAGSVLVSKGNQYPVSATVNEVGQIVLSNGEVFKSPSLAAARAMALAGGSSGSRNGWIFWTLGDGGPLLDDIRSQYLQTYGDSVTSDIKTFRIAFWDGFYEYCSNNESFVNCFYDPSERGDNSGTSAPFALNVPGIQVKALVYPVFGSSCGAELIFSNVEIYEKALQLKSAYASKWEALDDGIPVWNSLDENKISRDITVQKEVDFDADDWDEMYQWIIDWFFRFRELALDISR